jgi:parallel beta-helix repeat protein
LKEAHNHRKGFFHCDSLPPYFYIVLLRELDWVVGKEMERDEKMILGKGIVAFVMSMLVVCLVGNLFLIESCAAATTFYVDQQFNASTPDWHVTRWNKIHEAVENISAGGLVLVNGDGDVYNENVYIDKSIDVVGNYTTTQPRINGQDSHKSTIEIMSDNVTISGFKIYNTIGLSSSYSGIAVGKQENFRYDLITDCYITDAWYGIMTKGDHHTISNCEIKNIQSYGIMLVSGACNIIISYNIIDANLQGINLQSSTNNNEIYENTISNNREYGLKILSSSNNHIYHNQFIDNYQNAYDANEAGTNLWDDGLTSGGNYWSDYNNYDNNSDGIGDTPYQIPPTGDNKDNYPLGIFLEPSEGGGNQAPTAYITYITPNPATQGQPISFSGSGSDDGFITSYNWRSNVTGQLSTQASFTTSNLPAGVHTIFYKVQDNEGAWSIEKTATITINSAVNFAPTAYIDEITPNPAKQREAVLFRGHGTDEDGSIIAYKWLSNKDGVISTASSFSKTNLSLGTHTIYFQVKDNTEWSPQAILTLVVEKNSSSGNPNNQAPIADVGGPYQGIVNGVIMFDGSGSHDEEGAIVGYWNFGDNSSGTGLSPTHVYTAQGTYTVTLTVTDEDGDSTTASTSVAITQSTSQGNNAEGFSVFNLEIPFPIIIIVVFLSVLGVIIGFILRMKRG